jgi:riboflavin-specific deaminase-like protein
VVLKLALSLDGKVATKSGESRWISNERSRELVHQMRNRYAAVLVGVNTILRDDPQLTARAAGARDPWRIVLDSRGRIPLEAKVLSLGSPAPTVVATTELMPQEKERALMSKGARVWRLRARDGRVDLEELLVRLGEEGLDSLLVEGGPTVAAGFLEAGLVDKVVFFIAPKIIGGEEAPGAVGGRGVEGLAEAWKLKDISVKNARGGPGLRRLPAKWTPEGWTVRSDPAMIERYSLPPMRELWTEEAEYGRWLEVELAALEVLAECGEIPPEAARAIRARATVDPELIRRAKGLERELGHDLLAFLQALEERVGPEGRFLHFGLTSSDIKDTALALAMRAGLEILIAELGELLALLKRKALEHEYTLMVGRTHGVHAEPITFGLKLLNWHYQLERDLERLGQAKEAIAYGKLSGSVGTYAHLSS